MANCLAQWQHRLRQLERGAGCRVPGSTCSNTSSSSSSSSSSRAGRSSSSMVSRCRASSRPVEAANKKLVAFDLGSVAVLEPIITDCAFAAAKSLWPEAVVAQPEVYLPQAAQVLPAVHHPHEAVLLIRLLADEGIIGARSTAGREGPVVGRRIRQTGSRPLLTSEVLEHWEDVRATCLLRWSREAGKTQQEVLADVRQAFQQAQLQYAEHIEDQTSALPGSLAAAAAARRNPVVQSINGSTMPVAIVSICTPRSIAEHTLQQAGVSSTAGIIIMEAATADEATAQVLAMLHMVQEVHFVLDSPGKAAQVQGCIERAGVNAVAPEGTPRAHVHVASWACASPALRAKAASQCGEQLLSELELAQLMQAEHLDAVMDGVAWRRS